MIVAGAPAEGVEIHLAPKPHFQIQVEGLPPQARPPAFSMKTPVSSKEEYTFASFKQGSYLIEAPEPGDWQVKAALEDRTVTGRATVKSDKPLATLDLDPAFGKLTLSGHLAGAGREIRGMTVELQQEDTEVTYRPVIEEYGIFRFMRLRKGSYRLRVKDIFPQEILYEQDVEVPFQGELVIDLSAGWRLNASRCKIFSDFKATR